MKKLALVSSTAGSSESQTDPEMFNSHSYSLNLNACEKKVLFISSSLQSLRLIKSTWLSLINVLQSEEK